MSSSSRRLPVLFGPGRLEQPPRHLQVLPKGFHVGKKVFGGVVGHIGGRRRLARCCRSRAGRTAQSETRCGRTSCEHPAVGHCLDRRARLTLAGRWDFLWPPNTPGCLHRRRAAHEGMDQLPAMPRSWVTDFQAWAVEVAGSCSRLPGVVYWLSAAL
jgi:hypothetical protein